VLTGTLPFGKLLESEIVFKVLGGEKPSRPANAPELGLSDQVWGLLEKCWRIQSRCRPPVKYVLGHIKAAASVCGTLPPVGGVPQRYEVPESGFPLAMGIEPDALPRSEGSAQENEATTSNIPEKGDGDKGLLQQTMRWDQPNPQRDRVGLQGVERQPEGHNDIIQVEISRSSGSTS
jgi:hypothetical protein